MSSIRTSAVQIKLLIAAGVFATSSAAMAVGLGVNTGVGVNVGVPGVGVNVDAKAKGDAKVDAGQEVKGKSEAAVKGAKSQGDAMRSDAGELHSTIKGEAGKANGNVDASADVKGGAKVNGKDKKAKADAKAKLNAKAGLGIN